jgi:serine/threonine protein kinase
MPDNGSLRWSQMENLINSMLGGYELVEELGKGGMATVYKAFQPKLDRSVAVKVLDPGYISDDSDVLARFRREAKVIAPLRHPNILTVYDYGEEEGLAYIVMEYVEGGTLKDQLQGEPFSWERAVSLGIGVGRALAFAHGQGIVHRDVKPANILLPTEDWPLLADFGLVKLQQARRALTQAGMILGTPDYTSPEQALGESTDHRADIYALGVVLYEMVAGQLPFVAKKAFDVLLMHINDPVPNPRDLVADIPASVAEVITKAMAKSSDDRYQRMQDMVDSLESARDAITAPGRFGLPRVDETLHHATVQIDSIQSSLKGPRFVVIATGSLLLIPNQDEVLIGRADPRGNVVPDIDLAMYGGGSAGVSRQHARLLRSADGWIIEDLRSTNGTYVNDQLVSSTQPTSLNDGDSVRCGQLLLTFHVDETNPL